MSIINNIQGTLTQTQGIQQLQQQHGDLSRVQQHIGEVKSEQENEIKQKTINEQEDVEMGSLHKDKEKGGKQKNPKGRKRTIDEFDGDQTKKAPWTDGMKGHGILDVQA